MVEEKINLVEISGGAYNRGYEYGSKCKNDIERFVSQLYSIYEGYKLSKEQVLRRTRKYIPFIDDYSPEIAEEMRGIAEGAERDLDDIAMVVAYYEIYDRLAFHGGCTSFAVSEQATADGETYIGQNWDDDLNWYWNGKMPRLIKVKRKEGPDMLAYTYPGIPAGAGVNSSGISLCWNTMHCEEHKIGVPTYVIVTEVLHQKTIGDAIGAIITADRAESFNFVVADEKGEIYNVETTPSDFELIYADKCIGHANNFVSNKLKLKIKKDMILSLTSDTEIRNNRINKLLNAKCGKIGVETLMEILKDHVNYPYSICRHPGSLALRTFDSWVISTAKREMWLSHGNPCETEYQKYTLT